MKSNTVDDYLRALPPGQKNALEHLRKLVKQTLPAAEDVISYGVPAFKYNKRILIYYAGFKNHMSIFPASDEMVDAVGPKLKKFRSSKGTLKFTVDNPIPDEILEKIIEFRKSAIDKKL